ncbi:uncharacterized protein [Ptychodera flava]|uniref:uncharacterized protein n=1 Tax=Ptychodera flava TaxID=63121 RepID=UPI00396A8080
MTETTLGSSSRGRSGGKLYRLFGYQHSPWRAKRQTYGYAESQHDTVYGHKPFQESTTDDVRDKFAENQYDDYYGNNVYQGNRGNGGYRDYAGGDYQPNFDVAKDRPGPNNAARKSYIGGNYGPKDMWNYSPVNDYNSVGGHGLVPTYNPFRDSEFVPLGAGEPIGPDIIKHDFTKSYGDYFSDFDDKLAFQYPELRDNCWLQAMLAVDWGFSPNCKADGSYGPKQCAKKRCWCTNSSGEKVKQHGGKNDDGFYYGVDGLLLRCDQN